MEQDLQLARPSWAIARTAFARAWDWPRERECRVRLRSRRIQAAGRCEKVSPARKRLPRLGAEMTRPALPQGRGPLPATLRGAMPSPRFLHLPQRAPAHAAAMI